MGMGLSRVIPTMGPAQPMQGTGQGLPTGFSNPLFRSPFAAQVQPQSAPQRQMTQTPVMPQITANGMVYPQAQPTQQPMQQQFSIPNTPVSRNGASPAMLAQVLGGLQRG